MSRFSLSSLSLLASLALVSSATAAIQSVAGQVTQIGAPLSCAPGALTSFNAQAWNEQANVTTGPIKVNLTAPGFYTGSSANFGIVAGTFDSHFIHFEGIPGQFNVSGSVTFVDPIAAVIYENTYLDSSDPIFGSFGTIYPTSNPNRSLAGPLNSNSLNWVGNTLSFNLFTMAPGNPVIQLRVLTHPVPAPGSLAMLGLGGLVAARRRRR
ncbi:MAG: PEP-CTERM sorting domain-containing protein [Planctomycetota bacterium]|nr:PEP-CTERM sorting domain-containing protein [Planctomycetota bacterium]